MGRALVLAVGFFFIVTMFVTLLVYYSFLQTQLHVIG